MTVVVDASALVAALADDGPDGQRTNAQLVGATLHAPDVAPFECANIIRRLGLIGRLSPEQAAQAHGELLDLTVDLWPYQALARRAWSLRSNLTIYDATYVALAEQLGAPLVTLDRRLAQAPGVRCEVIVPGQG